MLSYHPWRLKPPIADKQAEARKRSRNWQPTDRPPEEFITTYCWAPGIFRDGHRCKVNFLEAEWIGMDFDDGSLPLAQAVRNFCDVQHVIGTTTSHTPEREKFRVLVKLEEPIHDGPLYEHQLKLLVKRYSLEVDKQALECARLFFPCREIISVCTDGDLWPIDRNMPKTVDHVGRLVHRAANFSVPMWIRALLVNPWPSHTHNDTCFRLGANLAPYGYDTETIAQLIEKSPTYAGRELPQDLRKEIRRAVASGIDRTQKELAARSGDR